MPKPSKTLEKVVKTDHRVESYEFEYGNEEFGCHWLYLKNGWLSTLDTHAIHERTVKECLDELKQVRKDHARVVRIA